MTAGLGRGGRLYDPEVSNGLILVGVEHPPDGRVADLQRELEAPPGAQLHTR